MKKCRVIRCAILTGCLLVSGAWGFANAASDQVVPAPWIALTVEGSTVKTWGPRLSFNGLALPSEITSRGDNLLDGEIEIHVDGKVLSSSGSCVVESSAPGRVVLSGEGSANGVDLKTKCEVEFDGLMCFTLNLDAGSTAVQTVEIRIPLQTEFSQALATDDYLYWDGSIEGPNGLRTTVGPVQELGFLHDYSVQKEGVWVWEECFRPYLWLGGEDRGLIWSAESMRDWSIAKEISSYNSSLQIVDTGEKTWLVIKPVLLKEKQAIGKRTWRFQLLATPSRPITDTQHRGFSYSRTMDITRKPNAYGTETYGYCAREYLVPSIYGYGTLDPQPAGYTRKLMEQMHARGEVLLTYMFPGVYLDSSTPFFYTQAWEKPVESKWWLTYRKDAEDFNKEKYNNCPLKPDYAMFHKTWIRSLKKSLENGQTDGLRWDGMLLSACDEEGHGHGFVDDNGFRQCTYPILERRKLVESYYRAFGEVGKEPHIGWHWWSLPLTPAWSFGTVCMRGEQYKRAYGKNEGYYHGNFYKNWAQAQGASGRAFGQYISTIDMGLHFDVDSREKRSVVSSTIQYDIIQSYHGNPKAFYLRNVFLDAHRNSEFYPFWRNEKQISRKYKATKCGFYKEGDELLLFISNWADEDVREQIQFNEAEFGTMRSVVDAESSKAESFSNGTFHVEISGDDYRLFKITFNGLEKKKTVPRAALIDNSEDRYLLTSATLKDKSLNKNNIGVNFNVKKGEGRYGQGAYFDGKSYNWMKIEGNPQIDQIHLNGGTVEFWVKPKQKTGKHISEYSKQSSLVSSGYWVIGWHQTANSQKTTKNMHFNLQGYTGGGQIKYINKVIPYDEWSHIAMTFAPGESTKLFYNGVKIAEVRGALGEVANYNLPHDIYIGDAPLLLGSRASVWQTMDDVVLWSKVLSEDEIKGRSQNRPDKTNPDIIAYYDFED